MGILVLTLAPVYIRESRREDVVHDYDPLGALSVTSGLIVLVYAISEAPDVGWATFQTIGLLVLAGLLLTFFLVWEWREKAPLMPLGIFRIRQVSAANVVGFLQAGGLFGSFLLQTLYMQQVLGLSVLQTGVAFLGDCRHVRASSPGRRRRSSTRVGVKPVLIVGLVLLVVRELSGTRRSTSTAPTPVDLLPGFLAVGIGLPFTFIPITIAALGGVARGEAGLAVRSPQHVPAGRRRDRDGRHFDGRLHACQHAARGRHGARPGVDERIPVGVLGGSRNLDRGARVRAGPVPPGGDSPCPTRSRRRPGGTRPDQPARSGSTATTLSSNTAFGENSSVTPVAVHAGYGGSRMKSRWTRSIASFCTCRPTW